MRAIAFALVFALGFVVAHGCTPHVRGGDSESHFVRCSEDSTCDALGEAFRCVEGRCRDGMGIDAGGSGTVPDGDATAGSSAGGNGSISAAPTTAPPTGRPDASIEGMNPGGCPPTPYPARVTGLTGGSIEIVSAQYSADLGDDQPFTAGDPIRYRSIGLNLDALCSTNANLTTCTLAPGSQPVIDGPGGIDNAFGEVTQLIRNTLGQYSSDVYTSQLQKGSANILLHVTGYNGQTSDDQVRVEAFVAARFDAYQKGTVPKWDGSDAWPIASQSVENNLISRPKSFDPNAYVSDGKLVATFTSAEFRILVGITNVVAVNLTLPLHAAYFVCTIAPTQTGHWGYTLEHCTLAGRLHADDLVHQLSNYPDPLDLSNPKPLCANAPSYPIFKSVLCSRRDIGSDFTSPTTPCNALSFGMAFETRPAMLGDVFANDVVPPTCPPGADPANDSCDLLSDGGG